MICIVDYGMGNLRSVQKGFEQVGFAAQIVSQAREIEEAEKIVLPGVGAFADGVAALRAGGLAEAIVRHIESGKSFLGICLGLQMLFEVGQEDGEHRGLGVLAGSCVRFDVDQTFRLKVPHMGWNTLDWGCASPLFKGLAAGCGVYFVHSYHVIPADASVVSSTTNYGRPFVSSICRGNVMATQFHPEKSQKVGLQILANFGSL